MTRALRRLAASFARTFRIPCLIPGLLSAGLLVLVSVTVPAQAGYFTPQQEVDDLRTVFAVNDTGNNDTLGTRTYDVNPAVAVWSATTTVPPYAPGAGQWLGGEIQHVMQAISPRSNEEVLAVLSTSRTTGVVSFDVFQLTAGGWARPGTGVFPLLLGTNAPSKPLAAVAYEQRSGEALMVYRAPVGTGGAAVLKYRTLTSSGLSAEGQAFVATGGNLLQWVQLVPRPNSDEILILASDNGKKLYTYLWDGAAPLAINPAGAPPAVPGLAASLADATSHTFDAAFEDGGRALLVYNPPGAANMTFCTLDRGAATPASTWTGVTPMAAVEGPDFVMLAAEPSGKRIAAAAYFGGTRATAGMFGLMWNGNGCSGTPPNCWMDVDGSTVGSQFSRIIDLFPASGASDSNARVQMVPGWAGAPGAREALVFYAQRDNAGTPAETTGLDWARWGEIDDPSTPAVDERFWWTQPDAPPASGMPEEQEVGFLAAPLNGVKLVVLAAEKSSRGLWAAAYDPTLPAASRWSVMPLTLVGANALTNGTAGLPDNGTSSIDGRPFGLAVNRFVVPTIALVGGNLVIPAAAASATKAAPDITVTEKGAVMLQDDYLQIKLPAAVTVTWVSPLPSLTYSLNGGGFTGTSGELDAAQFIDGKTIKFHVKRNLNTDDAVTIRGLQVTGYTTAKALDAVNDVVTLELLPSASGAPVTTATSTQTIQVIESLQLNEPGGSVANQVANQFTSLTVDPPTAFSVTAVPLYKFQLVATGGGVDLTGGITFPILLNGGLAVGDLTSAGFKLYRDGVQVGGAASVSGTAVSFGSSISVPIGTHEFVLEGTANNLTLGKSLQITLANGNLLTPRGAVTLVVPLPAASISGSAVGKIHTVNGYTVTVSGSGYPTLLTGSSATITWTPVGTPTSGGNMKIEYSLNGGTTYAIVLEAEGTPNDGIVANDGSFTWTVPSSAISTQVKIRVTHATEVTAKGVSSQFTVTGTLAVTYPSTGIHWPKGATRDLFWTSTPPAPDINAVKFEVGTSVNSGGPYTYSTIAASTSNDGTEPWTPAVSANYAVIRITDMTTVAGIARPAIQLISTEFAISDVTVTSPNVGTERWKVGTTQFITWTSSRGLFSNVKLEYSKNGGGAWVTILASTPNDGTEQWSPIPDAISTNVLVRISDAAVDLVGVASDVSNNPFSIIGELWVDSPDGGEAWPVGLGEQIRWTAIAGTVPNVRIRFSTDGGVSWPTLVSASEGGTSYENWIPLEVTTQARIQVCDVTDLSVCDASNANFATTETLVLSPPAAQATNALTAVPVSPPSGVADLFKMTLTAVPAPENVALSSLTFTFSSASAPAILASDLSNFELVEQTGVNPPTVLTGVTWGTTAATITATKVLVITPAAGNTYTLRAKVSNLAAGKNMTIGFELSGLGNPIGTKSNIDLTTIPGAISGSAPSKTHAVSVYGITLSSPDLNASQQIAAGRTLTIAWAAQNTTNPTAIEYSLNNGGSWVSTGCSLTISPCLWLVPANAASASGQALIRLSGRETTDDTDMTTTSSAFTVTGTLALGAYSPGGQAPNVFVNSSTSFPFVTTNADLFRFALTATGEQVNLPGLSFSLSLTDLSATDLSGLQLLKNGAAVATCGTDATCAVNAASIVVTPTGAPITVSTGAAAQFVLKGSAVNVVPGSSMTISLDTPGVSSATGNTSDATLSGVPNALLNSVASAPHTMAGYKVTKPAVGDNWAVQTLHDIEWDRINASNTVNVRFSTNANTPAPTWTTIVGNYTPPQVSPPYKLPWNLPIGAISNRAKIQVVDTGNPLFVGYSGSVTGANFFNINGQIMVTSPVATDIRYATDNVPRWRTVPTTLQTIQWSTVGTMTLFDVYLDGALIGDDIAAIGAIAGGVTGSFSYTPNFPSPASQIKVVDVSPNHPPAEQTRNVVFSNIDAIAPALWRVGQSVTISWTQTGLEKVNLYYLTNGGSPALIVANQPANTSYPWTVEAGARSPQTQLEIRDASDLTNGAVFTSTPFKTVGSVQLVDPPALLPVNQAYTIQWTTPSLPERVPTISLYLVNLQNGQVTTIAGNISNPAPGNGSHTWTPTQTVPQMKLRICDADFPGNNDPDACDDSTQSAVSGISVTQPTGGSYVVGDQANITWDQAGVTNSRVDLYYAIDDVNFTNLIVANWPTAAAGSYNWTINAAISSQVKVRVQGNGGTLYGDSGLLTVTGRTTVTGVAPAPAQPPYYAVGEVINVNWTKTGNMPLLQLQYCTSNCGVAANWRNGPSLSGMAGNSGSFSNWAIPADAISSSVQLRVADGDATHPAAVSVPFTITVTPGLTLTIPDASPWVANETHAIQWTANGLIDKVQLLYSINGGPFVPFTGTPQANGIVCNGTCDDDAGNSSWNGSVDWNVVDPGLSRDPLTYAPATIAVKVIDASQGHVLIERSSTPLSLIYLKVVWQVKDVTTLNLFAGLDVTETSFATGAMTWNVTDQSISPNSPSPVGILRYYPADRSTTTWTKIGAAEAAVVSGWDSNRAQLVDCDGNAGVTSPLTDCIIKEAFLELDVNKQLPWSVRQHFEFVPGATPTPDTVFIMGWLEKRGVLFSLVSQYDVEIRDGAQVIRTLSSTTPDAAGVFRLTWDLLDSSGNPVDPSGTYFAKGTVTMSTGGAISSGESVAMAIAKKVLAGGPGSSGVTLSQLRTELQPVKDVVGNAAGVIAGTQRNLVNAVNDIHAATVGSSSALGQVKNELLGTGAAGAPTIRDLVTQTNTEVTGVASDGTPVANSLKSRVIAIMEGEGVAGGFTGLRQLQDDVAARDQVMLERLPGGQILNRETRIEQGGKMTIQLKTKPGLSIPPSLQIFDPTNGMLPGLPQPMVERGAGSGLYELPVTFDTLAAEGEYTVIAQIPDQPELPGGAMDSIVVQISKALARQDTVSGVLNSLSATLFSINTRLGQYEQVMQDLDPLVGDASGITLQLIQNLELLSRDWTTQNTDTLLKKLDDFAAAIGTPALLARSETLDTLTSQAKTAADSAAAAAAAAQASAASASQRALDVKTATGADALIARGETLDVMTNEARNRAKDLKNAMGADALIARGTTLASVIGADDLVALQTNLARLNKDLSDKVGVPALVTKGKTVEQLLSELPQAQAADQTQQLTVITAELDSLEQALTALSGTHATNVASLLTELATVKSSVTALQSQVKPIDTETLFTKLGDMQELIQSAQGSSAAVGLAQGAYTAAGEALKILEQLKSDLRANGPESAAAPVLLGQFGDQLTKVTQGVTQAATVLPGGSDQEALAQQIKKLAEQAQGVASDKGYHFDSLYEMSEGQSTDVKTMRNQVEELKQLLEVQRAILEKNMNQPVMKSWFEAR